MRLTDTGELLPMSNETMNVIDLKGILSKALQNPLRKRYGQLVKNDCTSDLISDELDLSRFYDYGYPEYFFAHPDQS